MGKKMISIRNAKNAKTGLIDLCNYIGQFYDTKELTILEIGSYAGDSAEIFAERFKKVICVDPWVNGYDDQDAASYKHPMSEVEKQFDERIARFKNVIKMKMTSEEAASQIDFIDVVYIDGLHTYEGVRSDIELWSEKALRFVAGHDYQKRFPGTIKAVNEFCSVDKIFSDTSWIKKK